MKKVKILFYTLLWGMAEDLAGIPRDQRYDLVADRQCIDVADVVFFHMPTVSQIEMETLILNKKRGQLWVFMSMECSAHYKWQYQPEILGSFDITMTYKLDSDIPMLYLSPVYNDWLRRKPIRKEGFANAFISSGIDESGRVKYLSELMSYLEIHSYGKVLNNKVLENDSGVRSKANMMAGYKFSIAFENALEKDYVTEKFFHPLIVGSVPVYLGAPNVGFFAPSEHCYINARDFNSVRELAEYLLDLSQDEVRYHEYLSWKTQPFRPEFNLLIEQVQKDPYLKLYDVIETRMS